MLTVINVNWADVTLGIIVLTIGMIAAATYCTIECARIRVEDRRQRREFEQGMADVELPPWNGDTYEWTPEALAYLADTHVDPDPVTPFRPVPPSEVSGPLPVMDGPLDPDDFMAKLKADNADFLANLDGA